VTADDADDVARIVRPDVVVAERLQGARQQVGDVGLLTGQARRPDQPAGQVDDVGTARLGGGTQLRAELRQVRCSGKVH
jgi:hypothetical protein